MVGNKVVFNSILELAQHLINLDKDISPLRLQKSLYFLFAFYGASYGELHVESGQPTDGVIEGTDEESYPKYLFPEDFEAWKFGPVNRKVYVEFKNGRIEPKEWIPTNNKEKNINMLLNQVLEEIKTMGDFELVDRTHDDKAWKEAQTDSNEAPKEMDKEKIIEDYISYV